MNEQKYPNNISELIRNTVFVCGYSIDIAKVFYPWHGNVFELHIFDTGKFNKPDGYDDDMFETAEAGYHDNSTDDERIWLYGHAGFDVLHVNSTGNGDAFKYLGSEAECYELFYDDLLNGYLNKVLTRLPRIGSEEELRIWLTAKAI